MKLEESRPSRAHGDVATSMTLETRAFVVATRRWKKKKNDNRNAIGGNSRGGPNRRASHAADKVDAVVISFLIVLFGY